MTVREHRWKLGRGLAADTSGAAAVEFAFISISLLLLTFAILDIGFALYWFNRAEKATQIGVRMAAVSDPVADWLVTFDGLQGGSPPTIGSSCETAAGGIASYCDHNDIVCSVSGSTGNCVGESSGFSNAAFSKIFNAMRTIYPQLRSENVEVVYRPSAAGFAGRPGNEPDTFNLVPQITVRIVGLQYNYIALGSFLGLAPLTLPTISASMNAEDLNHTSDL